VSGFEKIREWTDVYAYSQPVKAVKVNNRDLSSKIRFIPCSKRDVGATSRAKKEKYQYQITLGFITAWRICAFADFFIHNMKFDISRWLTITHSPLIR